MPREPHFDYYDDDARIFATLFYKDKTFVGCAECAPDDMDMKNKRTGETIALMRAEIEYYKYVRDVEILPAYNAVRDLHMSMKHSKKYNEHSYEARRVRRHLYMWEEQLKTIRRMLITKRIELHEYLTIKDKLYHDLRRNKILEADKKG